MSVVPSKVFRPQDKWLYATFGGYVVATFVLIRTARSISNLISVGIVPPLIAILVLIVFQANAQHRCSPLAFCLTFAGILLVSLLTLLLAGAASASV